MGQGDGIGLAGGEPFIAGIIREPTRVEKNFAREAFFQAAKQLGTVRVHAGGGGGDARNSRASAASDAGTWTRMPPAASA